jgi:hypothetical protein
LFPALDPYCVIVNESERIRTPTIAKSGATPVWNCTFVFYRKRAAQTFDVELWDANLLKDRLIGRAIVREVVDNDCQQVTLPLVDKHGAPNKPNQLGGTLTLCIASYDDPVYL